MNTNTNRSDASSTNPFFSHYGAHWDPDKDGENTQNGGSNATIPTGNHGNPLTCVSLSISDNVATACHLKRGDPVYVNGHYLGQYDDTPPEDNTIDAYDPQNQVNNKDWGGTVPGGATVTNHP